MNKRFVTVKNTELGEHYYIDCKDTITAFKVMQHYHKLGNHKYSQIRLRSTPAPKKLGYITKKLTDILTNI